MCGWAEVEVAAVVGVDVSGWWVKVTGEGGGKCCVRLNLFDPLTTLVPPTPPDSLSPPPTLLALFPFSPFYPRTFSPSPPPQHSCPKPDNYLMATDRPIDFPPCPQPLPRLSAPPPPNTH